LDTLAKPIIPSNIKFIKNFHIIPFSSIDLSLESNGIIINLISNSNIQYNHSECCNRHNVKINYSSAACNIIKLCLSFDSGLERINLMLTSNIFNTLIDALESKDEIIEDLKAIFTQGDAIFFFTKK